jgi:hypothetical protein
MAEEYCLIFVEKAKLLGCHQADRQLRFFPMGGSYIRKIPDRWPGNDANEKTLFFAVQRKFLTLANHIRPKTT